MWTMQAVQYNRIKHFRPLLRQYLRLRGLEAIEPRVIARFESVQLYVSASNQHKNMFATKYLIPQLVSYEHYGNHTECLSAAWHQTWAPVRLSLGWPRCPLSRFENAARLIQNAFRLWKWRKTVLWNATTEIGSLHLQIMANVAVHELQ